MGESFLLFFHGHVVPKLTRRSGNVPQLTNCVVVEGEFPSQFSDVESQQLPRSKDLLLA